MIRVAYISEGDTSHVARWVVGERQRWAGTRDDAHLQRLGCVELVHVQDANVEVLHIASHVSTLTHRQQEARAHVRYMLSSHRQSRSLCRSRPS